MTNAPIFAVNWGLNCILFVFRSSSRKLRLRSAHALLIHSNVPPTSEAWERGKEICFPQTANDLCFPWVIEQKRIKSPTGTEASVVSRGDPTANVLLSGAALLWHDKKTEMFSDMILGGSTDQAGRSRILFPVSSLLTALARTSSNNKLQTRPLVREGATK
jgi:hypothetical protein